MAKRRLYKVDLVPNSKDTRSATFEGPVGASEAQLQVLATRAIRAQYPDFKFTRPMVEKPEAAPAARNRASYGREIVGNARSDTAEQPDPTSWREKLAVKAGNAGESIGLNYGGVRDATRILTSVGELAPFLGGAAGAADTNEQYRLGNYGMAGVSAAATLAGALPVIGKPAAAAVKGAGGALADVFQGVKTYEDALAMSGRGAHIRTNAAGNIMGSPGLTEADLPAYRAKIDGRIAGANREGLGWYDDSRTSIGRVSDSPQKATLLSRVGAAFSPQTAPTLEHNRALTLHNNMVLTGDSPSVGMPDHFKSATRGYTGVDESGYMQFAPENVVLGNKTGPYGNSKDPSVDMGWQAANDGWHGSFMGYSPEGSTTMYDGNIGPSEHTFLHGENTLATQRARDAGTLPADAMPMNFQEVGWVDQRKQGYLAEKRASFIAAAAKKGRQATDAEVADYVASIEGEALAFARGGVKEAVERNQAVVSREYTPGGGLGEMESIANDPVMNKWFADEMGATEGARSGAVNATQMFAAPTERGTGFWNDPVAGLQSNPAFMDLPQVALAPEPRLGPTGEPVLDKNGVPKTDGMAMRQLDKDALGLVGRLHGIENMQHGVGANIFVPANSSHTPAQRNGIYYPADQRGAALQRAAAEGFDVVDNGDGGIVVTSFSGGADLPKRIKTFAGVNGGTLGRFDNNYIPSGYSEMDADWNTTVRPQGQGIATQELLDAADQFPLVEQRTASGAYPQEVAQRNAIREKLAAETGQPLREDAQRLRKLLAQGGIPAVRQWVAKNGAQGLPVWLAGILGASYLTSEDLSRQEQNW